MIKAVNGKNLKEAVWEFMRLNGHNRPMIVWCQWGTFASGIVNDALWTYGRPSDKILVTNNDDESVDIKGFISESLAHKKSKERLICVSVMPFDNPESFIEGFADDFECIRYQVDPQEWLKDHPLEIHEPIVKFIRKHPEYLMIPYGEKPSPSTVGPCPAVWLDIAKLWAYRNLDFLVERYSQGPRKMVKRMMRDVAVSMGKCEPLFTDLKWFLLLHRGYRDLMVPERKFYDRCDVIEEETADNKAEEPSNFTEIFD